MTPTKRDSNRAQQSESLTVRLLQALSVHPTSIRELAAAPADQVAATIACALRTPCVASVAGWVVETLRRQRDAGWPDLPRSATCLASADDTGLFRLGSDVSDLGALLDTQPELPDPTSPGDEQLSSTFRAVLSQRCARAYRPLTQALEVRLIDNQTVVFCRTVAERLKLLTVLSGALRWVVADLGLPPDLVVIDGPPTKVNHE